MRGSQRKHRLFGGWAPPLPSVTWSVTGQGRCLEVRRHLNNFQQPDPPRGKCVGPMSRASRMRLLRTIAKIHFGKHTHSLFITLTYPDIRRHSDYKKHTTERSLFVRYIEKYVGRQVAILWRKEWKVRKSGAAKGSLVPHYHLICFGVRYIPKEVILGWWRTILGVKGPLMTRVDGITDGEKAARYTCKYAAKVSLSGLDNDAYLNTLWGRPWGMHRKSKMPWCPREQEYPLTEEQLAMCREREAAMAKEGRTHPPGGFTLFYEHAAALVRYIAAAALDRGRRSG